MAASGLARIAERAIEHDRSILEFESTGQGEAGIALAELISGATDGINNAIRRGGSPPATSPRPAIRVVGPTELLPEGSAGVTIESASPEAIAAVVVRVDDADGYFELDLGHVATLDTPASFRLFLGDALEAGARTLSFSGVSYFGEVGPAVSVPVQVLRGGDAGRPPHVAGSWRVSGSYSIYMFEGCAFSDVEVELSQSGGFLGGVVRGRPARAGRRLHGCRDVAVLPGRVRNGMLGPDGLVSFDWHFDEPGEPDWHFSGVVGATAMTGTVTRGSHSGGWSAIR